MTATHSKKVLLPYARIGSSIVADLAKNLDCRAAMARILCFFTLAILSAQSVLADGTGLPLNFTQLPNPASVPDYQNFYVDTDETISLGNKTPLILIHGIDLFGGPPATSADEWNNFCTYFYETPSLRNRYKIYRFAYRSNIEPVSTLGAYLSNIFNYLNDSANNNVPKDQQFTNQNVVVLAHSMGGLVARNFMEMPRQEKAVKWNVSVLTLITLAMRLRPGRAAAPLSPAAPGPVAFVSHCAG